jgi:uncharacterized protein YpbB
LLDPSQEALLTDRVRKAIDYFSKSMMEQLFIPLEAHIQSLKGAKKVRQYLKRVRLLRNVIAKKVNAIGKVQYGEVRFNPAAVEVGLIENVQKDERKERPPKGSSLGETLAMLQGGMRPSEIAEKRGLALSTIEGHMGLLVKAGDIDIHQCMEETKIENILSVIREIETVSMQPVKQKLGDNFSYGEIRAVMNHLQLLEK